MNRGFDGSFLDWTESLEDADALENAEKVETLIDDG
jgi:hypothetical protein